MTEKGDDKSLRTKIGNAPHKFWAITFKIQTFSIQTFEVLPLNVLEIFSCRTTWIYPQVNRAKNKNRQTFGESANFDQRYCLHYSKNSQPLPAISVKLLHKETCDL